MNRANASTSCPGLSQVDRAMAVDAAGRPAPQARTRPRPRPAPAVARPWSRATGDQIVQVIWCNPADRSSTTHAVRRRRAGGHLRLRRAAYRRLMLLTGRATRPTSACCGSATRAWASASTAPTERWSRPRARNHHERGMIVESVQGEGALGSNSMAKGDPGLVQRIRVGLGAARRQNAYPARRIDGAAVRQGRRHVLRKAPPHHADLACLPGPTRAAPVGRAETPRPSRAPLPPNYHGTPAGPVAEVPAALAALPASSSAAGSRTSVGRARRRR